MKRVFIFNCVLCLTCAGLFSLRAQSMLITNSAAMAGHPSYAIPSVVAISAFNGETAVTPNALISSNSLAYIGVNSDPGDPNVNAINDRDTTAGGPDQERLRLDVAAGHYLSALTWQWSRADGPLATDGVTISGFNSDPGAVFSGGVLNSPAPSYSAGKLKFQISAFNGTIQTIGFTNMKATTNATLEITVADSTQSNAQFAVRNFSIAPVPVAPRRVNLAKYQVTTASTVNGQYQAAFATDGFVNNDSWRSLSGTTPQWLEVDFPITVTVRSAQVYSGVYDGSVLADFSVQAYISGSWVNIPGSIVTGNTSSEVNVIFDTSISSDRFRLYSNDSGSQTVKEFALYPPNPNPTNGVEQGFPLGTDVDLDLAKERPATATSNSGVNDPKLAVDGLVDSSSEWRTTLVGSNSLEIDLRIPAKIGSAHLYSGEAGVLPIANFLLQYWTGSAWADIGGGAISNNAASARVITFNPEPITRKVRLVFTNSSTSVVRELCIFPANGGAGYAVGQDVAFQPPPSQSWNVYGDAYYNIRNRAANLSISVISNTPSLNTASLDDALSDYQLLLNIGTGTYRLRNRVTGKCLAGAGLSTNVGAPLVDEDYTDMPHQNWRLEPYNGTDFFLVNEWSGLVIDTLGGGTAAGTSLVQNVNNGGVTQRWRFEFQSRYPRKGLAGYVGNWSQYQGNWAYNWGLQNGGSLPAQVVFNPMQWGNYNWDIGSNQGPLEQFLSAWHRQDKAMYLMGFNEPDGSDQSNISVADALALWPRLEQMNVPLVSPVTKNPGASWMDSFMNQANSLGYRIDAIAAHVYPGPNGGSSDALVSQLQSFHNAWGLPVWLTEFSVVNWDGTGTWTEEDNYNWLAEFMWRAESIPWLQRYSLFLFTANANNPTPINPWDPVGPRSNAFESDGTTPTPFGELYFAWDGDANVRTNKAYFIHNKGERKRIQDAGGGSAPGFATIRTGDSSTQWALISAGTAGQFYITSLNDGRRLRYSGGVVDLAPVGTTGLAVTWELVADQYGWFYIENSGAPASNRRLKDLSGSFSMVSSSNSGDPIKWRFIVPYHPVSVTPPNAPVNLAASPGVNQVVLSWGSGGTPNTTYRIYRSLVSGGGYSLLDSNIYSTAYLDTTAMGGIDYYYVVTAMSANGFESGDSNEAMVTPTLPLPDTPTNLDFAVSNNSLVLSWPSNYTGWLLQSQTVPLSAGLGTNWITISGSDTNHVFVVPVNLAPSGVFYRLKRP